MLERTTQPMTDAVIERPQTLIEKLEQEVNRLLELKAQEKPHSPGYVFLGHHIAATVNAINIVKQHSDWISVDERLPEPNKLVLVAIHRPQYYVPDFMYIATADYDEVRKKWSSINLVDDLHNVVYWQPFPVIPKPPSEVQDD